MNADMEVTLIAKFFQSIAAVIAVGLVVAGLWAWNEAGRLAMFWNRPDVGAWGIRSGAVASAAGAQALLLACVAGKLFRRGVAVGSETAGSAGAPRRDVLGMGLKIGAGVVCAGALVSAVALGLAGR
jgi:hypothetical protein